MIGLIFSTGAQDYLYTGEEQTGTEAFSALGASYEIIYIDGEEALLMKGGELVDNQGEIEAALYQYYVEQYYPSQSQIDTLTELLTMYHDSREDGNMWADIEEEECRMGIFLHAFPCTNESIPTNYEESKYNDCYLTASVLCDEYGDYLGCSDPVMIMPIIQDFAISSNKMTEIQEETLADLANLSEENIYEVFLELKENMDDMEGYEEKLEETPLRVPYIAGGDECNQCFGMCPPIIIDEEHLESAEELVDEMLPHLEYIGDYEGVAQSIYDSTIQRTEFKYVNEQRAQYLTEFEPEKTRAEGVLSDAEDLLDHVSDNSVISNSERVREVIKTIEQNINNSEFGTMDADLGELDAKLNVLEGSIGESWVVYNQTVDAKERADAVFFTLDTMDLSENQQADFNTMKAEKRTQDRSFVDGLSQEKYTQITETYTELTSQANVLLNSAQQAEQVVDTFKGAGTKTNEGLMGLASTMAPLDRTEREEVSEYAPLMVSSLAFFSISSLAVFIFMFAFATFSNIFRNKLVIFFGILLIGASVLFAGMISGGIYLVLESSSTDASFNDFQSYVFASPQVSIMVETEGVHSAASGKMMECAHELADSLTGKEVIIYEKTNSECVVDGTGATLAECYNSVEEPIIMFTYSTVDESPHFMTGFVYKGTFSGDEEYFSECQMATGFVQTGFEPQIPVPEIEGNDTGETTETE
ncbi:MAG: hypothetical protein GY852_07415 [bacterium]|nr:hypothetical protein [bacterium]